MSFDKNSKFVILIVLDGWGIAANSPGNAIALSKTPNISRYFASYPSTQLIASGQAVGLPRGEDGNTETGHLNLGAGRVVYQGLERINMSIADGTFFENKTFNDAINHSKNNNSDLHLMGLVGTGGVHSNIEHLFALIHLAKLKKVKNLYLHLFTDGRDSPPTSAITYINMINEAIKREGVGKIASVIGRYWAMDRDQRWERTTKAYLALTKSKGIFVKNAEIAINNSYKRKITDEFIEPSIIVNDRGKPVAAIKDGDAVIFFNFRVDRPRQLSYYFVFENLNKAASEQEFDPYKDMYIRSDYKTKKFNILDRGVIIKNLFFATMTEYSKELIKKGAISAYPPEQVKIPIGRILSISKKRQLRITESEKERFVTFYFNGLREKPFPEEEILIIPSPKIPTYDLSPEMSSEKLTKELLKQLKRQRFDFILVNYPNPDMLGHTGNIDAAITAIEKVDKCVGNIVNFALGYEGAVLITADHGNVEEMINNQTGQIDTEHSNNPVPFIAISKIFMGKPQKLTSGILADVAPTILKLLGVKKPNEMTGRDLLQEVKI